MPAKLVVLVVSLLLLGGASADAAPSLTLGIGPDPAESITTQLTASGATSNTDTALRETVKATGGQACGANYEADVAGGGSIVFDNFPALHEGPFSESVNHTFDSAGSYLLCGWLEDESVSPAHVVAATTLTVSVRAPHLALSISTPPTVAAAQTFQLTTTAQAEVARVVHEYVLPNTGRGCPANASAAASTSGALRVSWRSYMWSVDGGPFSESVNETINAAGQYLVCAYFEYPNEESPPELTASAAIAVVVPPPPCIVPTYGSTATRLKAAEQAIRSAGCTVGAVRKVASRAVRAGYVIRLSATPGAHLAPGAAVGITVSTGPPCIVPHVAPGTTLGRVELRLQANHCSVGRISSTRSRRIRHGRVLHLLARTGQVLPSHAPIAIVVARRGH